jgi:pentatricopeptide repeat protein
MKNLGYAVEEASSFISVIQAFAEGGDSENTIRAYHELEKRMTVTPRMYSALIKAFGKGGDVETAIAVFQDVIQRKTMWPNSYIYANLINAASQANNLPLISDIMRLVDMHPPGDVTAHPYRASMVRTRDTLTHTHTDTHTHTHTHAHTHT